MVRFEVLKVGLKRVGLVYRGLALVDLLDHVSASVALAWLSFARFIWWAWLGHASYHSSRCDYGSTMANIGLARLAHGRRVRHGSRPPC